MPRGVHLFWAVVFLAVSALPQASEQGSAYQSAGTKKMAALLRQIYEQNDWKADPNKPAQRVVYYRALLEKNLTPEQEVTVRLEMGKEQLRAGNSEDALHTLEDLAKSCQGRNIHLPTEVDKQLELFIALSYLRLGEQENCSSMHGQKSCIFPIQGSGIHSLTRGAEGAVKTFTEILDEDSKDDAGRWLLNIAYMQLGKYPQGVPAKWLIPADLFKSEYDIGDFLDVAPQAGVAMVGHAGGVILDDFDGDGLLDLMISSSAPMEQLRFFHNNGDGTFSDRTRQAGLTGEVGGLNIVEADYNNDGYPDVLVLRGGWWGKYGEYPMSLLRNNGNGTFDDVTAEAGLLSVHPTQTAAWADFDNDGWLDLFVGVESTPGNPHVSQLFHNNHDGTFTEVAAPNGLANLGFVKGVAWGDFNNDGFPDLYVSVLGGANHLFRNDGPRDPQHPRADQWKFTDVTEQAGVAQPLKSFATWFFDYDNDGWPDIYVSGYWVDSMNDVADFEMGKPFHGELPRLYHNNHDGTFTDVTKAMHLDRALLPMGANFGDLDNDGWLDIYLGTGAPSYQALLPNKMFRNNEGKVFQDVTTSGGFGHLQKGHSIAFGDIENNGNEDVFEGMGGALPGDSYQSVLYRNPGHGNHWITLELEGVQTNRAAFGARIALTFKDQGTTRHVYRTVGYGSSFGGNPLRQHIGIGKAASIEKVEIYWPVSQTTQIFTNVAIDRAFHVREGASKLEPRSYKQFAFSTLPLSKDSMGMQH
ncbi:VCBS repeat-containing protein [Alloacidobacterium dinghuense]|uniref:VCBS repeat-containing protein n=1 Tax=Alloacidobacterium dinghuense TaxID=2763107 RepID=A0A7G8BFE1_9BACT|nr:FG-GAP-like repeat-containing protein [Alloacidobacterium dinghuense]QNI31261.1 VCBS repeat-containing protein [Alloacidobacterium dinghuense]